MNKQIEMVRWLQGGISAAIFVLICYILNIPSLKSVDGLTWLDVSIGVLLLGLPFSISGLILTRKIQLIIDDEVEAAKYIKPLDYYGVISLGSLMVGFSILIASINASLVWILIGGFLGSAVVWYKYKPKNTQK